MIAWDQILYDNNKATKDFEQLKVKNKEISPIKLNSEFGKLREELISARDQVFEEHHLDEINKLGYEFDLAYGLELYEILNKENGFTNRVASNNEIWSYLSIKVIPDIVHSRFELNPERYFEKASRIWLRTIWYYIHLSWAGSKDKTYEILKNNTTDTILQLVDRKNLGYYTELYREIMLQYANINDRDRSVFRRALVLNTAKIESIYPNLVKGSISGYVTGLFNDSIIKGD